MSYHIYTTDGIILKRLNFGEANILLFILTDEFGLISASAQAARESFSKLNSALQEYSLISVSCVKAKNGWKITNATAKENFFFDYSLPVQKFVSRVSTVLVRMIPGEEKHRELFSVIYSSFEFLKNISEKDIPNFEILTMLRILYYLGYVEKSKQTEKFLQNDNKWGREIIDEISGVKSSLIGLINKGFEESQL